jgi:hypothetical protein
MSAASSPPIVAVAGIGPCARAALREGAQGRVLAVFRRSVYVRMDAGDAPGAGVACLGPLALGAGALNALCAKPPHRPWPALAVGDPARVREGVLHVGAGGRYAVGAAPPWLPPAPAPVPPARRAAGLARLRRVCAAAVPARGLAALLLAPERAASAPLEAALHRQVRAALAALEGWLAHAGGTAAPLHVLGGTPAQPIPEALPAILGLGGGLTPAGDDLLAGALIALHALGCVAPAEGLAAAVLAHAPARTGAISAAHLAAAARGLGAAPLHAVLEALGHPHTPDAGADGDAAPLKAALRRLDAIGHTSGWDALAGVVAVWSAGRDPGRHATGGLASGAAWSLEPGAARQGECRPC